MNPIIATLGRMSLSIVILNYRTPELTVQCLTSVADEIRRGVPTHVVVVDNNSGDDSVEEIRAAIEHGEWMDWCELLPSEKNLGFAGGNNLGIRYLWRQCDDLGLERPEFVLLLNSDTVVHDGCLHQCLTTLKASSDVGALTCKLLNGDGSLQVVARKFMSPLRLILGTTGLPWIWPGLFGWAQLEYLGWDMNVRPGYPDWIGGAFMMIRGKAMDGVGLLDDDFFFYGEDVEYCYRLRNGGWKILYDPSTTTTHFGGSSSDPSRLMSEARSKAVWRARYLFLRKCYGWWPMWLVRCIDIAAIAFRRLWLFVTRRSQTAWAKQLQLAHRTILGSLGPL